MGLTPPFEWWQLWSCHLTHWGWSHLLLNLLAALPVAILLPRRMFGVAAIGAVAAAPLLSFAILFSGTPGEYRGASGLVVALWCFTAIVLLREHRASGVALAAAILLKLSLEALGWWPQSSASFTPLPVAHYAGAVIGTLGGLAAMQSLRRGSAARTMPLALFIHHSSENRNGEW
ncbi:MAG TPA: rhomboid family intramembrane serine protease [Thermoanaerobaculia bacterium]|nr:rhomboid family intramembrane serine protease [Thermoanaerobaculia bacterium]